MKTVAQTSQPSSRLQHSEFSTVVSCSDTNLLSRSASPAEKVVRILSACDGKRQLPAETASRHVDKDPSLPGMGVWSGMSQYESYGDDCSTKRLDHVFLREREYLLKLLSTPGIVLPLIVIKPTGRDGCTTISGPFGRRGINKDVSVCKIVTVSNVHINSTEDKVWKLNFQAMLCHSDEQPASLKYSLDHVYGDGTIVEGVDIAFPFTALNYTSLVPWTDADILVSATTVAETGITWLGYVEEDVTLYENRMHRRLLPLRFPMAEVEIVPIASLSGEGATMSNTQYILPLDIVAIWPLLCKRFDGIHLLCSMTALYVGIQFHDPFYLV